MSVDKYFEKNDKLAFELAIDMLGKYAKNCEKAPGKGSMDPILGSYLLMHQLCIGLFYKAEGFENELTEIMNDAINDAKDTVKKSTEAS